MANIMIYYQEKENESTESAVKKIDELIKRLETRHTIKGVFLDKYNARDEFTELVHSELSDIQYLIIDEPFKGDFEKQLTDELSRAEDFKIIYFNEM